MNTSENSANSIFRIADDLKPIKKKENVKALIINDIVRLVGVYSIAHLLEVFFIKKDGHFMNKTFLYGILFFAAAIIIYHLLIKKFIFFDDTLVD
jgi:hypothetical protein